MGAWIVTGREKATGKPVELSIVAQTETQARAEAVAGGVLIEAVRNAPAPSETALSAPAEPLPCPACGSTAPPVRKRAKGSVLAATVLLPIFLAVLAIALFAGVSLWLNVLSFVLLLGLLVYAIFSGDYDLVCPNCGALREGNNG